MAEETRPDTETLGVRRGLAGTFLPATRDVVAPPGHRESWQQVLTNLSEAAGAWKWHQ